MRLTNISFKIKNHDYSVLPGLFQVRAYTAFVFGILTVILDYSLFGKLLATLPLIALVICMVLFYKKLIAFRMWYIIFAGIKHRCEILFS